MALIPLLEIGAHAAEINFKISPIPSKIYRMCLGQVGREDTFCIRINCGSQIPTFGMPALSFQSREVDDSDRLPLPVSTRTAFPNTNDVLASTSLSRVSSSICPYPSPFWPSLICKLLHTHIHETLALNVEYIGCYGFMT